MRLSGRSVLLTLCVLAVSSCGGGGGGGGGGAGSEGDNSSGVRVLHAAIDGAPVDVVSSASSSPVLSHQVFAGSKGYRSLRSTPQSLQLTTATNSSAVIGSFSITPQDDDKYTVLLYGDNTTFGLLSRIVKDEVPTQINGAAVRIMNGVTRAAALTVTIGGVVSQSVEFGQNSEYVEVPAGEVNISSVRASDGRLVQSGSVPLMSGQAYTFLIAGEVGYYVKGVLFSDF